MKTVSDRLIKAARWPAAEYPRPVVLVCGDGLDDLFGAIALDELALRVTEQGCYVRVPDAGQLLSMAADITAMRPTWSGQLSVMFVVNPSEHIDSASLAGRVRSVCYQLSQARRRGLELPLLLLSYLQAPREIAPWFSWDNGRDSPMVHVAGSRLSPTDWQAHAPTPAAHAARLQTSVRLNAFATWLAETVMPPMASHGAHHPADPPVACAVTWVPALARHRDANLWQRWLKQSVVLTGTDKPLPGTTASLPFPDALLHLLPVRARVSRLDRRKARGLWLLVLASVIALASSAWQNTLLIREVTDDLHRYNALPAYPDGQGAALRGEALAVLRQDARRLDGYYRQGEPWSLGLGLYRGEHLRGPLLATIAGHRQPARMATPVTSTGAIRLESLSLFSTGSAQLKPDSTRVLVKALVDIKAQPGSLVVIAGHTDGTGSAEQNLLLSRARAAAVHAWMLRMSDIPDSCFAVQGFGASQPIASNDTEHGRSANRRVEIRLVPEAGACAPSTAGSGLQPQPHSAALND